MKPTVEARVSRHFKVPAEKVYDAWLDPQKVRVWMEGALKSFGLAGDIRRIEIDARVGGKFFFSDMRDGNEARHWGTYLELQRPNKIVFTWIVDESAEENPSKVTMTIQSEPGGCVAAMVHEMDAAWKDYIEQTESGWSRMLANVEQVVG
jgi:uncharacterized protein YndB with AHSA1/START domain